MHMPLILTPRNDAGERATSALVMRSSWHKMTPNDSKPRACFVIRLFPLSVSLSLSALGPLTGHADIPVGVHRLIETAKMLLVAIVLHPVSKLKHQPP